jgi:hypothetical protein
MSQPRATIQSFAAKVFYATKKFFLGGTEVTASAAELNILDGVTKTSAQINLLVAGAAGGYKIARGQHTTVDENDTVVTGLATVVAITATLESDPVDGCQVVSASIGNQTDAPVAGSVYIKTWKATAADNSALIAATTFSKKVNWIAIGT